MCSCYPLVVVSCHPPKNEATFQDFRDLVRHHTDIDAVAEHLKHVPELRIGGFRKHIASFKNFLFDPVSPPSPLNTGILADRQGANGLLIHYNAPLQCSCSKNIYRSPKLSGRLSRYRISDCHPFVHSPHHHTYCDGQTATPACGISEMFADGGWSSPRRDHVSFSLSRVFHEEFRNLGSQHYRRKR